MNKKASFFLNLTLAASSLMVLLVFSNCGYQFSGKQNPWSKRGLKKMYIEPFINDTSKPGLEVAFTTAIVKAFSVSKRFEMVGSSHDADVILQGSMGVLKSTVNSQTSVASITKDKKAAGLDNFAVASDYSASGSIFAQLTEKKTGELLWSQSFGGSKFYPANNRFGLPGVTSMLINSSQEELALNDIAVVLATDLHDALNEAF